MLFAETTFLDVFWYMLVFFLWLMFFWVFISVVADIFRRDDISGWAKAGWLLLIIVLPLLGILIYVIARPKMTAQDVRMLTESAGGAAGRSRRLDGGRARRSSRSCTPRASSTTQEYENLKQKAMS